MNPEDEKPNSIENETAPKTEATPTKTPLSGQIALLKERAAEKVGASVRPLQPATAEPDTVVDQLLKACGALLPDLISAQLSPPPPPPPAPLSNGQKRLAEIRARLHGHAHADRVDIVVMDVPVKAIDQTKIRNIRFELDPDALRSMCESLKREAQLQEILVVADPHRKERYSLVAGFLRYAAAAALGWSTIRAVVLPADTPEAELYFVNAVENSVRRKLSSFDIASRAQFMRDRFGTALAEYARRLGLSDSRVQNLVRQMEALPSDVLAAWRAGDQFLNDHMRNRLAGMPRDEASAFFAAWKARQVANLARPPSQRNQARRSQNRPTTIMLSRLSTAVRENPHLDRKTRELLSAVVEFCAGFAATVPGIFDPKQPSASKRRGRHQQVLAEEETEPELKLPDLKLPGLNADGTMPLPSFPEDDET
jgi:ParB/RepB/Spo0J family partition protein